MDHVSYLLCQIVSGLSGLGSRKYLDWKRFLKSRQSEFKKLVNSSFLGFEVDEVLMYRVMPSHLKEILILYSF